jgi:hypothetical protein
MSILEFQIRCDFGKFRNVCEWNRFWKFYYGLFVDLQFGIILQNWSMNKHPGFKSVQKSIAKRGGYSMKPAGAILADASRHASPAAIKKNPRLRNIHGIGR